MLLTRTTPLLSFLLLALANPACAPADGGQVGEETAHCQSVASEELLVDDATPLGFTVNDVLSLAATDFEVPLRWADGTSSTLHVTLTFRDQASYQDREWVDDPSDLRESAATDCLDILNLEMRAQLRSDDGALDEDFEADLQAAAASEARLSADLSAPMGSLEIEGFAPPGEFTAVSAYLEMVLRADGLSGSLIGQAQSDEDSGDDGTVSARSFDIASFGAP